MRHTLLISVFIAIRIVFVFIVKAGAKYHVITVKKSGFVSPARFPPPILPLDDHFRLRNWELWIKPEPENILGNEHSHSGLIRLTMRIRPMRFKTTSKSDCQTPPSWNGPRPYPTIAVTFAFPVGNSMWSLEFHPGGSWNLWGRRLGQKTDFPLFFISINQKFNVDNFFAVCGLPQVKSGGTIRADPGSSRDYSVSFVYLFFSHERPHSV